MKITCDRHLLDSYLSLLVQNFSGICQPRILNYVLLEAESPDTLALTVFDGEQSVYVPLEAAVEQSGAIAVPLKELRQIVHNLYEEIVSLSSVDTNLIEIETNSTEIELEAASEAEFVLPQVLSNGIDFALDPIILKKGIENSTYACGNDRYNKVLTGANIQILPGKIEFWGTNSFRLAHYALENSSDEQVSLTIPAKTLKLVERVIGFVPNDRIKLTYSPESQFIKFKIDKFTIVGASLDGYPQCDRLIPELFAAQVILNRHELLKNLQVLEIVAKDKIVRFKLNLDEQDLDLIVTIPQIVRGERKQTAEIIGTLNEREGVCLNVKYTIEAIAKLTSEKIKILLNDWHEPVLIEALETTTARTIIMPIQIR